MKLLIVPLCSSQSNLKCGKFAFVPVQIFQKLGIKYSLNYSEEFVNYQLYKNVLKMKRTEARVSFCQANKSVIHSHAGN